MASKDKKSSDKSDGASVQPDGATGHSIEALRAKAIKPLQIEEYDFNHGRRGKCVIINNEHFNYNLTRQNDRDGTHVDAEKCENIFMKLGFDVRRFDDLTTTDMNVELADIADEDHSSADCFVLVILSHGDKDVIYGTNGKMPLDKIVDRFKGDNCKSLVGKPKLFFIQACRGTRYDYGVAAPDEVDAGLEYTADNALEEKKVPIEADVLLAHSAVDGYFSWRNNVDGSWFIDALYRVFDSCADRYELMQMMTLINHIVARDFQSDTGSQYTTGMKSVPSFTSTLTKQVYLYPMFS